MNMLINDNCTKASIIDIGSSSVRFVTAGFDDDLNMSILHYSGEITELSKDLHNTGILNPHGVSRTIGVIDRFIKSLSEKDRKFVEAIGTEAFRKASNGMLFMRQLQDLFNISVEILTPIREGGLALLGSSDILCEREPLIDLGGGSTEFITNGSRKTLEVKSFPLGAAYNALHIDFSLPISFDVLSMLRNTYRDIVSSWKSELNVVTETGVVLGGTITTIAAIVKSIRSYKLGCVHGSVLTPFQITKILEFLARMNAGKRETVHGMEKGRGKLIINGTLLLDAICDVFQFRKIKVSEYGIVFGKLQEIKNKYFLKNC
ncbi:hypothetical protein JW979_15450 [bacterium]|nr:hypothetical protein [candidate division CSSED10-310 bacterium]